MIKKLSMMKVALCLLLIASFVTVMFHQCHVSEGMRDVERANRIQGWKVNFENVDRIQIQYGSNSYEVFHDDDFFYTVRDRLNPFSRDGFFGDAMVDVTMLELVIKVVYYVGERELFEAGIYLVPENMNLYSVERMISYFNDSRVVIVLDKAGWFGGLDERTINLNNILLRECGP